MKQTTVRTRGKTRNKPSGNTIVTTTKGLVAGCLLLAMAFLIAGTVAAEVPEKNTVASDRHVTEQGLSVRVGKTIKIIQASATRCAYASAFKLPNGDIIVSMPWPRTGVPIQSVRSKDGGKTWEPSVSRASDDNGQTWLDQPTPVFENFCTLDTGEVVGFDFPDNPDSLWIFNSDGTKGVRQKTSVVGKNPDLFWYQHTLVQLVDGRLLATSQGISDKQRMRTEQKSHVVLHVSENKGLTWKYYSTVAFDLFTSYRQEGFSEPRLKKLPNGELIVFMRTGNPDTAARKGYGRPTLVASKSADNGKTWCAPMPVAEQGVYPDVCIMENGVVSLAYGRPKNNMVFSADNGNTWICRLEDVAQSVRPPDCGYYNSIIEITPGTLLLVHGSAEEKNQPVAKVLGTFLYVETN